MVNRVQFFKVMSLFARCQLDPKITASEAFVREVMSVLDEVEDFNEIASRLQATWFQYSIDSQRKEKHHGV